MQIIFFLFAFLIAHPADAAELVMFEQPLCEWCELWQEEVGGIHVKTQEARVALLRWVDIDDDRPADLETLQAIVYTPTFVLMEKGREVGRITGYPGEDHFWGLLQELLGRSGTRMAGCRHGTAEGLLSGES